MLNLKKEERKMWDLKTRSTSPGNKPCPFLVHLCISKVISHFLKKDLGHRVCVLNCWQPFGQNLKGSTQGVLLTICTTWQDSLCRCVLYASQKLLKCFLRLLLTKAPRRKNKSCPRLKESTRPIG